MRNGPVWLFCHFELEEIIADLKPDLSAVARLSQDFAVTGFTVFAFSSPVILSHAGHGTSGAEGEGFATGWPDQRPVVHIRCFAPAVGVPEDPVTGSANAALPAYLAHHGLLDRTGRDYVASQGTELGRDGRVYVRVLDDEGLAEIGGRCVTVIDGEIRL